MMCRNLTGKYIWTAEPVYRNPGQPTPDPIVSTIALGPPVKIREDMEEDRPLLPKSAKDVRLKSEEDMMEYVISGFPYYKPSMGNCDLLQRLLEYVSQDFRDHLVAPDDVPLEAPKVSEEVRQELNEIAASIDEYCRQEDGINKRYDRTRTR